MPFGAADVFAALAAITTGTIALQVMAQTTRIQPSKTLAESNRRQTMGMLALLSPAVSCMLAVFVCLDRETRVPSMLPYVMVVLALAGMNCFIAADAVDRITRIDKNNRDLKIAMARKQLSHYRRKRLPWMGSWSVSRVALVGFVQITLLSTLIVFLDVLLFEAAGFSVWSRRYPVVFTVQLCLFVSFAAFAWTRTRFDRSEQWLAGFMLLLVITVGLLATVSLDPLYGVLHALLILGVPSTIFMLSMRTMANRSTWWIPSWVPGTWVRLPAALATSNALKKTRRELETARRLPGHPPVEISPLP